MSTFENQVSYLFVKITEPYSLNMTFSFLQEFADVCKQENVVVNRSGNFKVFHEMESALKWLRAEE